MDASEKDISDMQLPKKDTSEKGALLRNGSFSHTEGYGPTANGFASHAEGYVTTAGVRDSLGVGAHSEGMLTTAQNNAAHAEGFTTSSTGYAAHAEGYQTAASGTAGTVVPTLFEGRCPFPILESLIMGTPVAFSRIAVAMEVIGDPGPFITFDPYDVADMQRAIGELWESGQNTAIKQKKALSGFLLRSWRDVAREYYNVFDRIIS